MTLISRYSLQYGERLAGLSANISKSEVRNFGVLLKETKKVTKNIICF